MNDLHINPLEPRRYLIAYRPDLSWQDDGVFHKTGDSGYVQPLAIQDDGKLLYRYQSQVKRLNLDGSPDKSFSPIPVDEYGYDSFKKLPSGRFLTTAMQAYLPDGSPDRGFGSSGKLTITLPKFLTSGSRLSSSYVDDFAETASGDLIVLVGVSLNSGTSKARDFGALLKYDHHGNLYGQFNGSGAQTVALDGVLTQLSIDSAGRISIGQITGYDSLTVARFLPNGKIDTSLNRTGSITIDTDNDAGVLASDPPPIADFPFDIGPDGSFYYPDFHLNTAGEIDFGGIRRRLADGSLDTAYGRSGWLRKGLVQFDNGNVIGNNGYHYYRFNINGVRDKTFGDEDGIELFTQDDVNNLDSSVFGKNVIYIPVRDGIQRMIPVNRIDVHGTRLRITGTSVDDDISIRQLDGLIRVQVGSLIRRISLPIESIDVTLDFGNNRLFSDVNLPVSVTSGSGNDTVTTGDGDDTISLAGGKSIVRAGGGYDVVGVGDASDIDIGVGGGKITASTYETTTIHSSGGNTDLTLGSSTYLNTYHPIFIVRLEGGKHHITVNSSPANIQINSRHGSIIDVDHDNSTIIAGRGDDRIFSSGSVVYAGGGNDYIEATGGTVHGGDGDDTIIANEVALLAYGDYGDDTLVGGRKNDSLHGGFGQDQITGNQGNDYLYGDEGTDHFKTADGYYDYIDGGTGNDSVTSDAIDQLFRVEIF